ncbi:molybdopterin-guanine dinucleotide biosynthesis protein B [Fictibacillus phosphorivorans]|uniref:molybdopterin-guanine dinucleotide biosynthesis protein B n=1 Tax=Fictibacillus phosphorivorans TaxID=1221500 RepID=UPI00203FC77B|nr:molybdopterin-guanine dinucleotide biosynthesis protein B [Fictibacillus phosphorivorans]MCM3719094.1 molybdopterin-guanine dinucleotide biosynthesis protein B [Fictibacillus phosphorivorans]MCM3776716.1 molybdopterin-guanine dinucleotide biosynthesis protein B [Fictibacillus phosphorivorans]
MGFPVILQVAGYQNSGKTTVITKLLKELTKKKIKTAVIKHHGHSDVLNLNDAGKDTEKHREAGAFITGISSKGGTIFSMNDELPLEKTIEVYKALDIECVLIEGYKQIQYPRVLLCRNSDDSDLINKSNELIAIINRDQLMNQPSVPQFIRSEETEWIKFMMEYLTSRVNEERA